MRTATKNLIKLHNVHIKAVDAAYIEPIEMLFLLSLTLLWFFLLLMFNIMTLLLKYYLPSRDEDNLEHQGRNLLRTRVRHLAVE
jgi:hypothetical protein